MSVPQSGSNASSAETGLEAAERSGAVMSSDRMAWDLTQAMAAIHRRGWCDGTGGNFSCVRSRDPLSLLMAPSGVDKGQVEPEQLIVVDRTGDVIAGSGRASAETALHLEIVRTTGAGAVLHTHSQAGTLLSQWCLAPGEQQGYLELRDLEMLKGLAGIHTHATSVQLPALANDQNVVRLSANAAPHLNTAPKGLLIAGHGLYAWGANLSEARRHLEILEFLLEQRWRQLLLTAIATPRQPQPTQQKRPAVVFEGISHVLLDIEGTTCPVSFVSEVLFPYASRNLPDLLQRRGQDPKIKQLIGEVEQAWRQDPDPAAQELRREAPSKVAAYLQLLIRQDRKLSPLKELQGLVWAEGYRSGELVGPLFSDVPPVLAAWHQDGHVLAVYSSGSVAAQQLLYGHSQAGDLRPLFTHWYDTRTGPKQSVDSYRQIAAEMAVEPKRVLFISDALSELNAAEAAGMAVAFSDRAGNPHRHPGPYRAMQNLEQIRLEPPGQDTSARRLTNH